MSKMLFNSIRQPKLLAAKTLLAMPLFLPQSGYAQTTIATHKAPVHALAFSPDGSLLASETAKSQIKIWNVRTRRVEKTAQSLAPTYDNSSTYPASAAGLGFTPDGRFAVIVDTAGIIKLLDCATGQFSRLPQTLGFDVDLIFAGNAARVVDKDGQLWQWNSKRQFKPLGKITGENVYDYRSTRSYILTVAISHDSSTLLTCTWEEPNKIQLWDINRKALLRTIKLKRSVECMALSPDKSMIAVANGTSTIYLVDVRTRKTMFALKGHRRPVTCLAFSPDGKTLASGGKDSQVKLWRVPTIARS